MVVPSWRTLAVVILQEFVRQSLHTATHLATVLEAQPVVCEAPAAPKCPPVVCNCTLAARLEEPSARIVLAGTAAGAFCLGAAAAWLARRVARTEPTGEEVLVEYEDTGFSRFDGA